jgi:O-succinylbenzoic acid--CoA ligase
MPVELNERLLKWSCEQTKFSLGLKTERIYCCLPVRKTAGFMQLLRALCFGWEIHFAEPSSKPFEKLDENHNFTLTSLSPLQLYNSLGYTDKQIARFKNILVGGGVISQKLQKMINKFHKSVDTVQIYETYGMTETASHIALRNLTHRHTYLKPQLGVMLHTDEHERLIITINELQMEFKTEDVGFISFFGFKVLGRSDRMINTGGIKIHAGKIEVLLEPILRKAGLDRFYYISKTQDDALGDAIVLVFEGAEIKDEAFLLQLCKRDLPPYHDPKSIRYQEEFERTDTGKIIPISF